MGKRVITEGKFMAKIRNYDGFGGCISAPINVKFGTWERTFTGQSVAYAGRKTHFRPLSKNNIGMAALRASLPVKKTSHFFVYSRRATHDHHHTWHGDRGGPCHFCTANFYWSDRRTASFSVLWLYTARRITACP